MRVISRKSKSSENAFNFPLRLNGKLGADSLLCYVLLQIACAHCLLKSKLLNDATSMNQQEEAVIYEMCIDTPAITHGELVDFIHVLEKSKCQINDFKPSDRNVRKPDGRIKSPQIGNKKRRPFLLTSLPQKTRRVGGVSNYQQSSSTSQTVDKDEIHSTSPSEADDESDTEPGCIKIVNISDDTSVSSVDPPPRRFARMSTGWKEPGQKRRRQGRRLPERRDARDKRRRLSARRKSHTKWVVSQDD